MTLASIVRAVAHEMGRTWFVAPGVQGGDRDVFLSCSTDGARIHVTPARQAGRLVFTGSHTDAAGNNLYPHWPYRNGARIVHEITVSATKEPRQIADDIQRRLLPAYRAALSEARQARDADDETNKVRAELVNQLAYILGAEQTVGTVSDDLWLNGELSGNVRVESGRVVFRLNMPPEMAVKFAVRIRTLATADTS